jgi:hypothetical protein
VIKHAGRASGCASRAPAPPAYRRRPDRPGPTQRRRTPWRSSARSTPPAQSPSPGKFHSVGQQLAGRRITLRLETTLAYVVLDGVLTRTIPLTLTLTQRARLQGARMAGPAPQPRPAARSGCSARCPAARRYPNHRPACPCRATLCRSDRHHRSRRDHPARLRPPRERRHPRPLVELLWCQQPAVQQRVEEPVEIPRL